jgi:hypothetical protein
MAHQAALRPAEPGRRVSWHGGVRRGRGTAARGHPRGLPRGPGRERHPPQFRREHHGLTNGRAHDRQDDARGSSVGASGRVPTSPGPPGWSGTRGAPVYCPPCGLGMQGPGTGLHPPAGRRAPPRALGVPHRHGLMGPQARPLVQRCTRTIHGDPTAPLPPSGRKVQRHADDLRH